jgi:hypothetical protein
MWNQFQEVVPVKMAWKEDSFVKMLPYQLLYEQQ